MGVRVGGATWGSCAGALGRVCPHPALKAEGAARRAAEKHRAPHPCRPPGRRGQRGVPRRGRRVPSPERPAELPVLPRGPANGRRAPAAHTARRLLPEPRQPHRHPHTSRLSSFSFLPGHAALKYIYFFPPLIRSFYGPLIRSRPRPDQGKHLNTHNLQKHKFPEQR